MWQTVDYKGNTVKWYEAELIERIKKECKDYDRDCIQECGIIKRILDLIQENEG